MVFGIKAGVRPITGVRPHGARIHLSVVLHCPRYPSRQWELDLSAPPPSTLPSPSVFVSTCLLLQSGTETPFLFSQSD